MTGSARASASRPLLRTSSVSRRVAIVRVPFRSAGSRDEARFSIRSQPQRAASSWACLFGPAQRRFRPAVRRAPSPAHRGYRHRPAAVPEFEAAIYEDLAWLGLRWEEPVRRQSEHFDDYRAAFRTPEGEGAGLSVLLLPQGHRRGGSPAGRRRAAGPGRAIRTARRSIRAPARILPAEEVERRVAAGEPHAWRIDMAAARHVVAGALTATGGSTATGRGGRSPADPWRWGDAVIVRKDVPTSYHLSVVVDDALQGVTHVVRGQDLEAATDLHVLLQALLGLPTPLYHHHGLVLDPDGRQAGEEPPVAGPGGVAGAGRRRRGRAAAPRVCRASADAQHIKPDEGACPGPERSRA